MTCVTEDPLAPRAHAPVVVSAVRPETVKAAVAAGPPPAGAARMPSTRVPPPATASSPADRRAREETDVLRRARPEDPAGPFISLVAPMGGYLQRHRIRPSPSAGARLGEAWVWVRRRAKHWPGNEPAT